MNKYILGFAIAILAATSANAQDCSNAVQPTKTWNQQPPDAPGTAPIATGLTSSLLLSIRLLWTPVRI
jgi:hypothetical protein